MCGIVGAFDLRGARDFPAQTLAAMCAALTHRGPDSEGHHVEPGLAMASRRLATLTGVVATQLWHHLFFGGGLCALPSLSL